MTALPNATRPDTMPPPPLEALTSRPRSGAGYLWAVVIAVFGVTVGVAWGATTYLGMQRQIDGFARAAIPGEVTVRIADAGGRVLYYEGLGEMPLVALDVHVVGPNGRELRVGTYGTDLRYDAPGGQVGHAVGTFDARAPGRYRIETRGSAPPGSSLAIGESIPASRFAGIVGGVLVVLVSLGTAVVFVIVTAIRRR
jgi:hypothetical protein